MLDGTGWLDMVFAGLALLLGGFGFLSGLEGWRQWSENRRIRKHLRN
jgi:hypothetical protein